MFTAADNRSLPEKSKRAALGYRSSAGAASGSLGLLRYCNGAGGLP
jgi:hypothetical protein